MARTKFPKNWNLLTDSADSIVNRKKKGAFKRLKQTLAADRNALLEAAIAERVVPRRLGGYGLSSSKRPIIDPYRKLRKRLKRMTKDNLVGKLSTWESKKSKGHSLIRDWDEFIGVQARTEEEELFLSYVFEMDEDEKRAFENALPSNASRD